MEDTKELITTDDIRSKVYIIRGQQVMLRVNPLHLTLRMEVKPIPIRERLQDPL